MKTKICIIFLLLSSINYIGLAQTDSTEKEKIENDDRKQIEDFENFAENSNQDFENFRRKTNEEYGKFLKEAWQATDINAPEKLLQNPKPKSSPIADTTIKTDFRKKDNSEKPALDENISKQYPISIEDKSKISAEGIIEKIDFYNLPIQVPTSSGTWSVLTGDLNNASISSYWEKSSKVDFSGWLNWVLKMKDIIGGGDYAVYSLVMKVSQNHYHDEINSRLFTWYTLLQIGFDARLGYTSNKVFLLLPVTSKLFDKSYYIVNQKKYYSMDNSSDVPMRMLICPKDFKSATTILDPEINPPLVLNSLTETKELPFFFRGIRYSIRINYCPQHLDYLFTYPQLILSDYLNSKSGEWFDKQLREQFSPILLRFNEHDKVQFLLSFVQQAFEYKTDEEQFGREKWFFPEEMIKYPFSDCDDRAILFSYLVRKLTGLKTVGLVYSSHVSTGVRFNESIDGDKIIFNSNEYTICDPTYIGAPIGMCMPLFKHDIPKVYE